MAKKREYIYSDNAEYQKEYQRTLKRLLISFNPKNADDVILWECLQKRGKGNIVPYIKELIRLDMEVPSRSCHIVYNRVKACHDCNDCGRSPCEYMPDPGETTRINCPLWESK